MAMPNPPISPNSPATPIPSVLRKQVNWENLHFFQKSDVLYQLAATFCERFLPPFGDRTVDQMIQAARSGKQNIETQHPRGVCTVFQPMDLRGNGEYGLYALPDGRSDDV